MVQNDIALIKLGGLVDTISEDPDLPVMPVCLPHPDHTDEPIQVKDFMVIGWGKSQNSDSIDDVLRQGVATRFPQKLALPLFDRDACGVIFPGINSGQICAGGVQDQDSCDGDSGGPLVDQVGVNGQMTLFGIVSAGSRVCGIGQPGIYTRVDHYVEWIRQNLSD